MQSFSSDIVNLDRWRTILHHDSLLSPCYSGMLPKQSHPQLSTPSEVSYTYQLHDITTVTIATASHIITPPYKVK